MTDPNLNKFVFKIFKILFIHIHLMRINTKMYRIFETFDMTEYRIKIME